MFGKILNLLKSVGAKAVQGAGVAALYVGASTCLAAILLGLYLKYAWNIDAAKYYKMLAIAQGVEVEQQQRAAAERVAEIGYENVLERRARRNRETEFQQESILQQIVAEPAPEDPKPEPKPVVDDKTRINAFQKYVDDQKKAAQSEGLAEETRLLENMEPEQAKEVIRKLWKDGAMKRVLEMLLAMEERRRGDILYTMNQEKTDELKDLCDIMQRIGNGEPMAGVLAEAEKAAKQQQ
ncbi:hypothetical protein FACS189454_03490 [Planctomycetales bacterium]|nr:hypothetical protein FACS189454_03490 [Planctomycetales bacterium]